MIGAYILHSKTLGKFYTGVTQDGVENRIQKHNSHYYGKRCFTSKASDWELILFIPAKDFAHAVRIERKIKSMKSAAFIRKLTSNKDILFTLVSST